MNDLLKELEAMRMTGAPFEEGFWSACLNLVQKSYVPEKTVGANRPCEEKDYREYRQIVDRNLRNIRSMIYHIVQNCSHGNVQIDLNASTTRTFTTNLLLLIGEHHEKNIWNTAESVSNSEDLLHSLLELYGCQNLTQFLIEQDNFVTILLALRPKLMKDTWKHYPAAVACYKWILHQVEKPALYTHIGDVLPTALILVDDYIPDNVVIGLECLAQIIQHSHLKRGLIDTGYVKVMFYSLERLTHKSEARYVLLVYSCITSLLATMEYWDDTFNSFNWSQRDDVLAVLLGNLEVEQNVELRHAYMQSLPQLLTNVGCAKWCESLTRILTDYCRHYRTLQTLKATLQTARRFLTMFHFRVAAHCVPLYSAFLRLHHDLTETPVFDKEIMQNLEDCICLIYKQSPNVGSAVIKNDRIRSMINNNLLIRLDDTRYFE
ncbi:TELO2-interacting protein 2 [Augochlora pura]